jgi:hypothetical protein
LARVIRANDRRELAGDEGRAYFIAVQQLPWLSIGKRASPKAPIAFLRLHDGSLFIDLQRFEFLSPLVYLCLLISAPVLPIVA